ncbi:hypothetical protein C8R43DRAFT_1031660 [Mycena crocata]|nr:hypothetical protein C8R43DRAFT_1031660 [Mycena crocata]
MTNLVDDAPAAPGKIALPLDPSDAEPSDPQPNDGAHLRKFHRRVLYVVAIFFTLGLVAFWEHPAAIGRPIDELALEMVDIAHDPRLEPYQTPDEAEYCAEWTEGDDEHLASASFDLPTTADLLFFLSRGPVAGHINVIENPAYSQGPIEVNVTAQYHSAKDLERTKVCRMGSASEHGVLVWAEPRHPHGDPRRDIRVNITMAVPANEEYKDLTTDLALFSHTLGDFFHLWSATSFEAVRLKTSNAAINHGSLIAMSAFIQTTNANVSGFFGGLDYNIQTSNAPILATAMMFGEGPGTESRVNLKTSNGAITTNMGIISDYPDNILRAFVQTSGAAITIGSPRQLGADNASFFLDASTSVGPAEVHLYPEFEGSYDLRTSVMRARVQEDQDVGDPARQGRNRTVTHTSEGQHARGLIYWSTDGEPTERVQRGSVKVTTTVSPVTLYC